MTAFPPPPRTLPLMSRPPLLLLAARQARRRHRMPTGHLTDVLILVGETAVLEPESGMVSMASGSALFAQTVCCQGGSSAAVRYHANAAPDSNRFRKTDKYIFRTISLLRVLSTAGAGGSLVCAALNHVRLL